MKIFLLQIVSKCPLHFLPRSVFPTGSGGARNQRDPTGPQQETGSATVPAGHGIGQEGGVIRQLCRLRWRRKRGSFSEGDYGRRRMSDMSG